MFWSGYTDDERPAAIRRLQGERGRKMADGCNCGMPHVNLQLRAHIETPRSAVALNGAVCNVTDAAVLSELSRVNIVIDEAVISKSMRVHRREWRRRAWAQSQLSRN